MLRESQSFELIRRLELHVKTLSEARGEDKKRILELERELSNCSQEIDYLQDQLKARNIEVNRLAEHVSGLVMKLAEMEIVEETVGRLREDLKTSDSERLFLMQELENKEVELQNSTLCIEKLEESISSVGLDYQCEIESMKLEMMALEQSLFEAKKLQEETSQEKSGMSELIQDYELRFQEIQKVIEYFEDEKKNLSEKLQKSEVNFRVFCQKMEEQFQKWLENKDAQSLSNELEIDTSTRRDILGPLHSKGAVVGASDADLKDTMEKMSHQIHEYELLVRQLKEELREEKLKANEEAEDLAQEMAELRYHITGLLEEECKRRACIEQISLQRIAELQAQIEKGHRKSRSEKEQMEAITTVGHIREA